MPNGPVDTETTRFIIRNLQKVYLAMGDAYLLSQGIYDVKVAKRAELMAVHADSLYPNYATPLPSKNVLVFQVKTLRVKRY